jgi:hypothetical protein
MKKICLFCCIICAYIPARSQDIDYAHFIVDTLSSPYFSGRGYTNKGIEKAAEFIGKEFEKWNIQPIQKSYYQQFTISVNTFPDNIEVKLDTNKLIPGIDYLIDASSTRLKGKYPITPIKRNDISTQNKFIQLVRKAGENFIYIDNSEKSSESKEKRKEIDGYIDFLKYSNQISCKGIIIYSDEKLTWDISSSENIRPIIYLHKQLNNNNIKFIDLNIQNKYKTKYRTQNIIGCIRGSEKPDSFIVITAHYDHLGQMGRNVYFPGANDNASGVAMLLNLAKYYSTHQPKYTFVFIALSAEELGVLGAKYFTENPTFELKNIKFLINFDLAGTGEEGIRVVNGSVYKKQFDTLCTLNLKYNLLPKVDIRGEACNSDHCMFYQKNVPCFYIYTQGGIKAYHDLFDKPETLPLTEFTDYCRLMILFFEKLE